MWNITRVLWYTSKKFQEVFCPVNESSLAAIFSLCSEHECSIRVFQSYKVWKGSPHALLLLCSWDYHTIYTQCTPVTHLSKDNSEDESSFLLEKLQQGIKCDKTSLPPVVASHDYWTQSYPLCLNDDIWQTRCGLRGFLETRELI